MLDIDGAHTSKVGAEFHHRLAGWESPFILFPVIFPVSRESVGAYRLKRGLNEQKNQDWRG
jgi:hypothetical protein